MKKSYRKQTRKIFAIITMLFAAALFHQNSYAEDFSYCSAATSWSELQSCINNNKDITLADDIAINHAMMISSGKTLRINLNNHGIMQSENDSVFIIYGSDVIFAGPGVLASMATDAPVIQVVGSRSSEEIKSTTVTVSEDVLVADYYNASFGIGEESGGYHGITINFYGHANSLYGFHTYSVTTELDEAPEINIFDSAVIFGRNQAIRAEGYAIWNIGNAEISGNTGIALKAGKFNLNGPNVSALGEDNAPHHGFSLDKSADVTRTEFNNTGCAIQIHENETFSDSIEIFIDGGSYVSDYGYAFCEYKERAEDPDPTIITDTLKNFVIYDGELKSFAALDDEALDEVEYLNVGMATEDFFWIYGDGRLCADGSASIKSYDPIWLSTNLTIRRFGKISGLEKIYRDADWIERLLIDYTSFDGPYYPTDFTDAQNVALDEYAIGKGIDYEDIVVARYAQIDPYRFESDFGSEPGLLGAGKPYTIIRDLGEEYPLTFMMPIPHDDLPEVAEGYERKLKVLNFECWMEPGAYGGREQCKIHELPVTENDDEYTFTTRYFSGFILSYDDEKIVPKAPDTGYNTSGASCDSAVVNVLFIVLLGGIALAFYKKVL